jgi:hypothetical protein
MVLLCALAAGVAGILVGMRYRALALVGVTALTLLASLVGKLSGFLSIGDGVVAILCTHVGYFVGLLVPDGIARVRARSRSVSGLPRGDHDRRATALSERSRDDTRRRALPGQLLRALWLTRRGR